jgi:hypothetical protein
MTAARPATTTDLLERSDYFRRSPARFGGRPAFKEWQHFVVHAPGLMLIVNFSVLDEPAPAGAASAGSAVEAARVIMLANRSGIWDGGVDRIDPDGVQIEAGLVDARFGGSAMRLRDGRYHVVAALAHRELAAALEFVPVSAPARANNHPLSAHERLSWLFVPRLVARGTVRAGGEEITIDEAPAYHDHNWGHFRWGNDFSWRFLQMCGDGPAGDWSAVMWHVMDGGRNHTRSCGLYLRRGWSEEYVFRGQEVAVECRGLLRQPSLLRVPPVMALVASGGACDVPSALRLEARGGDGSAELDFQSESVAQLLVPSEVSPVGAVTLNEISGRCRLTASAGPHTISLEGPGVLEYVHP